MPTLTPRQAFARLATSQGGDQNATKVAHWLIEKSIGLRRSIRPRGTVTQAATAKLLEKPLVEVVSSLEGRAAAGVLHAVAEWGGEKSAEAISDALDGSKGWTPEMRLHAIHALGILGGERAVVSLAKAASGHRQGGHAEGAAALDALEALASAESLEVDEGGMMDESDDAMEVWEDNRDLLRGDDGIGGAIALLERLEDDARIGRRARAVRGLVITAAQERLERRARQLAARAVMERLAAVSRKRREKYVNPFTKNVIVIRGAPARPAAAGRGMTLGAKGRKSIVKATAKKEPVK
jgi:hypothetical protein